MAFVEDLNSAAAYFGGQSAKPYLVSRHNGDTVLFLPPSPVSIRRDHLAAGEHDIGCTEPYLNGYELTRRKKVKFDEIMLLEKASGEFVKVEQDACEFLGWSEDVWKGPQDVPDGYLVFVRWAWAPFSPVAKALAPPGSRLFVTFSSEKLFRAWIARRKAAFAAGVAHPMAQTPMSLATSKKPTPDRLAAKAKPKKTIMKRPASSKMVT